MPPHSQFTYHLILEINQFSQPQNKIISFSSWMEAWNIYLAVCIDYMPSRASSLVAYQCIITSASIQYLLESWLNYDVQFRTLAASDPSLRWDICHPDLGPICNIFKSKAVMMMAFPSLWCHQSLPRSLSFLSLLCKTSN